MGTYGDKPLSRFKSRRIRRRLFVTLTVLVALFVACVAGALIALNSVAFWKAFILPHYFGPYWETAVSYDEFDPMVLPPGIRIKNLRIHEPNEREKPFLQIGEAVFQATLATRPDHIVLDTVGINSVSVNLVRYEDGETNMGRALNRMFEGRTPRSTGTWISRGIMPEIETPPQFTVDALTLRYEDRTAADAILSLSFTTTSDIQVDVLVPRGKKRGLLHRQWIAQSLGQLRFAKGDAHFIGEVFGAVTGNDLIDLPDASLDVLATLTPRGDPAYAMQAQFTMPLDRVSVRPHATVFEDFTLEMFPSGGGEPIVRIDEGRFDPLTGELDASIQLDAPAAGLYRAIKSFTPAAYIQEIESVVGGGRVGDYLRGNSQGWLSGLAEVRTSGLFQYAVVDDSERLPLLFEANGQGVASEFGLGNQRELRALLLQQGPLAESPGQHVSADVSTAWNLRLDERAGIGEAWWRSDLVPRLPGADGPSTMTLAVHDASDAEKPMIFHPFRPGALEEAGDLVRGQENELLPFNPILPRFRAGKAGEYNRTFALLSLLDILGAEQMALEQFVKVHDTKLLLYLISPLVAGPVEGDVGEVRIGLTRHGAEEPLLWHESFLVKGIGFEGVEDKVDFSGDVELARLGERFELRKFDLQLDAGESLRIGLAGDEDAGEREPMWINPGNGHFRVALEADALRPNLAVYLERIRISGLDEVLAKPFTQRVRDILGLSNTHGANGKATLELAAEVGSQIHIDASGNLENIPVSGFVSMPDEVSARLREVSARFDIAFGVDPLEELVFPERFSLRLYQGPGAERPLSIQLNPAEETAFRLNELGDLLYEESKQISAGVLARSKNLSSFLSGFIDRLERIDGAMAAGSAEAALVVPGIDFSEWQEALHEAGLPFQEGELSAALRATLSPLEDGNSVQAEGTFQITGLKLPSTEAPLPSLEGSFKAGKEGERLYVRDFDTALALMEERPETRIQFNAWASVDGEAMDMELVLDGVNERTVGILKVTNFFGINEASTILDYLPISQFAKMAGTTGNIQMAFEGTAAPPGEADRIVLTQTATGLEAMPWIFQPLSFQIKEEIVLLPEGNIRLERLEGDLHERGTDAPLTTFALEEPLVIGGGGSGGAAMRITVEKDFSERPGFLAATPIPLFRRFLTGGELQGSFEVLLPENRMELDPDKTPASHGFFFHLKDIALEGFPDRIDGVLRGELARDGDVYTLEDVKLDMRIGEEDAGRVEISAAYYDDREALDAQVELVAFRTNLLGAMPPRIAEWTTRPGAMLDARMSLGIDYGPSTASLTMSLAGRNLGLPLGANVESPVPPLNLDMQLTSHFDSATSRVLVQNFHADVVAGSLPQAERLKPANPDLQRILRVVQLGPIIYNTRYHRLSSINPEGAGLEVDIGPISMEEYGGLVRELAGIPLEAGTVAGRGLMQSLGRGATRIDQAQVELALRDGAWRRNTGRPMPLEADILLLGGTRTDVLRIDEVSAEVRYPQDEKRPRDQISLKGFYEEGQKEKLVEIKVESGSLALDRIIGMVGDVQNNLNLEKEREKSASSGRRPGHAVMDFLNRVSATVTGRLNQVTFHDLVVPDIDVDAQVEGLVLVVEHLRSRLLEGMIDIQGQADFAAPDFPWTLFVLLERVEARPWVDSFAASDWQGDISGRLSADVHIEGRGFRHRDLVETLKGSGMVKLEHGQVRERGVGFLLGQADDLEAEGRVFVRNNVLRFRVETPWNPFRWLLFQGYARPVLPGEGERMHYYGLLDFQRTTVVGPREGGVVVEGRERPIRQKLYGVLLELSGVLGTEEKPRVKLRTIEY